MEKEDEKQQKKETEEQIDSNEEMEEETYELEQEGFDPSKPVTMADLLASREKVLRQRKIHIGTLSSGLLENPEEKITNLRTLLTIMSDETTEAHFTVRKLAVVSLLEVFKDLLPSYQIKLHDASEVKCKKRIFFS